MIVDAVVLERQHRLDVMSPILSKGLPLAHLDIKYKNRPVKLVTCWSDIPYDSAKNVHCNEQILSPDLIGTCEIPMSAYIVCDSSDAIYIMTREKLISK